MIVMNHVGIESDIQHVDGVGYDTITKAAYITIGYYKALADGSAKMIGTVSLTSEALNTAVGNIYRSAAKSITLPSLFTETPIFTIQAVCATAGIWAQVYTGRSATNLPYYIYSATSVTPATTYISFTAEGRWR